MRAAMALPLLVSGALWIIGARLGRWLPPATAVRLLSLAAVVTALSTGFVLAIAAFLVLARVPAIATLGHWSTATVSLDDPIPTSAGLVAGATVLVLLCAALRRFALAGRDLATAAAACRRLGPGTDGLVIVDDEEPDAYALQGLTGRVVVSTAMLRALPADERRVLLAHEAAHLSHYHHVYMQLAELGAAANPLLRPLAVAVRDGAERWADEDAAAEVGDRALAARALARAGLARALASCRGGPGEPRPGERPHAPRRRRAAALARRSAACATTPGGYRSTRGRRSTRFPDAARALTLGVGPASDHRGRPPGHGPGHGPPPGPPTAQSPTRCRPGAGAGLRAWRRGRPS